MAEYSRSRTPTDTTLAPDVAELVCAHLAAAGRSALLVEIAPRHHVHRWDVSPRLDGGRGTLSVRHVSSVNASGPEGSSSYALLEVTPGESRPGAPPPGCDPGSVLAVARRLADVVLVAGSTGLPQQLEAVLGASDAIVLVVENELAPTRAVKREIGKASSKLVGVVVAERRRCAAAPEAAATQRSTARPGPVVELRDSGAMAAR